MDSKGGSWQQSGGLLQPPWLSRRKASPWPTTSSKLVLRGSHRTESSMLDRKPASPLQLKPALLGFQLVIKIRKYGGLAQLGERLPCKQEVSGSIPLISTNLKNRKRLTEVPWQQETSLNFLEKRFSCTLKTEHCYYDAIMRRQQ